MSSLLKCIDYGLAKVNKNSKIGIVGGNFSLESVRYLMLFGLKNNLRNSQLFIITAKELSDYGIDTKDFLLAIASFSKCRGKIDNQIYPCIKVFGLDYQGNIKIESPYLFALHIFATKTYGTYSETPYQEIITHLQKQVVN